MAFTGRASTTASEESVFTEADEREIEELINTRTLAELKSMCVSSLFLPSFFSFFPLVS
jgi:hypothetical protein